MKKKIVVVLSICRLTRSVFWLNELSRVTRQRQPEYSEPMQQPFMPNKNNLLESSSCS